MRIDLNPGARGARDRFAVYEYVHIFVDAWTLDKWDLCYQISDILFKKRGVRLAAAARLMNNGHCSLRILFDQHLNSDLPITFNA